MRRIYLFIIIILLVSCQRLQTIDIDKIDFFGFKVNYTYDQIIKELKKQNKDYIESKKRNLDRLLIIELKNQYSEDNKRLDFTINLFDNKLMILKKYNIPKEYLNKLIKKLGKKYKIENINELINYNWNINDFEISYQTQKGNIVGWDMLVISNEDLLKQFKEYENSIYEVGKFLTPTIEKLRLRESPSLNGKFIRSLQKGELLTIIEIGKEDTIDGKNGKWIKVKTNNDEIGWCFSGYLEKTL